MKNIAIFASGSGSNFEAIVHAINRGEINAKVSMLVCNKPKAKVISRAKRLGIPVNEDFSAASLKEAGVAFIVLAGYMRILSPEFVKAYEGRIVNIHPSLLPAFPGLHAIPKAYESGAKTTGVTVHYVDEGVDTGPIIAQEIVEILPGDTLESLESKIHEVEHKLYISVLKELFK